MFERDIRTLLATAHLYDDSHDEDVFVAGFADFVRRRRGAIALPAAARDLARDALDALADAGESLALGSPTFADAVERYTHGIQHILAAELRQFVAGPVVSLLSAPAGADVLSTSQAA